MKSSAGKTGLTARRVQVAGGQPADRGLHIYVTLGQQHAGDRVVTSTLVARDALDNGEYKVDRSFEEYYADVSGATAGHVSLKVVPGAA